MAGGVYVKTRFGLKLFILMIAFAIVISFTIVTIDYLRLREQAIDNNQFQIQKIEDTVEYSLKTIDKAYFFFDNETAVKMEENTQYILEQYKKNPNFDKWDFHKLQQFLGMDIYIINDKNVITHSNFEEDIGMDFSLCCSKLVSVLNERRSTGSFYHDGMDIEQKTGSIKKYSYMATHDKQYLVELGYSLERGTIFNEFNFLHVNEELVRKYPAVNEINVLNIGGYSLGTPVAEKNLTKARREAFEKTLQDKQTTEVNGVWKNEKAIYRYVHFVSEFDEGTTKNKVIEIIYNEKELQAVLNDNKKAYYLQLIIIFAVTTLISFIISRWVSKPMHLAFHDSLTGVKNRTAFDEFLASKLPANQTTALMMIDLDNFKMVNDYLGHDEGDNLLRCVAECICETVRNKGTVYRYGGDEFIVVLHSISETEAEKTAMTLITEIENVIHRKRELTGLRVSASIGISLSKENNHDAKMLYKRADMALYASKEKGKNQYHFYSGNKLKEVSNNG